ncbi:unnamed protein product, partial [Linum tenue]
TRAPAASFRPSGKYSSFTSSSNFPNESPGAVGSLLQRPEPSIHIQHVFPPSPDDDSNFCADSFEFCQLEELEPIAVAPQFLVDVFGRLVSVTPITYFQKQDRTRRKQTVVLENERCIKHLCNSHCRVPKGIADSVPGCAKALTIYRDSFRTILELQLIQSTASMGDKFRCKVTITDIDTTREWCYLGCDISCKAVVRRDAPLWCDKCEATFILHQLKQ